jgi:UDP-GlcNAc:undecaprenyl-phosphate GlcNAc-1-phosphate transferase
VALGGLKLQVSTEVVLFVVAAFAVAIVMSYLLTPVAIRIASRVGAIDEPDSARRVHRAPVARLGGIAVGTTFVLVGVGAIILGRMAADGGAIGIPASPRIRDPQVVALFVGVVVAMILGFVDDRWQIRARWQLLGQLALAGIALIGGITFVQIANPFQFLGEAFGDRNLDLTFAALQFSVADAVIQPVPILLTTLWIVGMINCINWIDGLDGLSTGVSLIAALTLGVISITSLPVEPLVSLLCAVLAGSLAGFLPWNFHPARVFIGTAGVMFVGYVLAVLSIMGSAKVAVALLVLGVPIIDTFWIIIRRLASGTSPFEADRGHLHHRLLDLGLTHRGAVLLIYAIAAVLGIAGLLLSSSGAGPLYAFLGIVIAGGLALYLLTRHTRDPLDAASYSDDAEDADAPDDPVDVDDITTASHQMSADELASPVSGDGPRPSLVGAPPGRPGADILRAP